MTNPVGDADPEDAYDVNDSILERLVNLDLRLRWFTDGPLQDDALAARMARARDDLRLIGRQLAEQLNLDLGPTLPPIEMP